MTRTKHASGDEDINNVLHGVDEASGQLFDQEWQSVAGGRSYRGQQAGGGARALGQDRRASQSHALGDRSQRQPPRSSRSSQPSWQLEQQPQPTAIADQYGSGTARTYGAESSRRPARDIGPVPAQIGNRGQPGGRARCVFAALCSASVCPRPVSLL